MTTNRHLDPVGGSHAHLRAENRVLREEIGRLRRRTHRLEVDLAATIAELEHTRRAAARRWWHPR